MIYYKDKTFCPFFDECHFGKNCHRALTNEIWKRAQQVDLPIAQFVDKPDCFLDKRDI